MTSITIRSVASAEDLESLKILLVEYFEHLLGTLGAEQMDVPRFQHELTTLPLPYEILLLAFVEGEAAGCVLLKPLPRSNEKACELKRLWTRAQFRGHGLGRRLAESGMAEAKRRGYKAVYLDTVPFAMQAAIRLYEALGFTAVERYSDTPVSNIEFFRREL